MKLRSPLILVALLGFTTLVSAESVETTDTPPYVCTPEEALKKAEETAITINEIAAGDAAKAERLHNQLIELQQRDPTRSDHGACEAYDRVIKELREKNPS